MDTLPDEIVFRIGEYLDDERLSEYTWLPYQAQHALAALVRVNKRFHLLLNDRLYLHPTLNGLAQARAWSRTYSCLVDPFKRAPAGKAWPPTVAKPVQLSYNVLKTPFSAVTQVLLELDIFSNLRELHFDGCAVTNDFIPLHLELLDHFDRTLMFLLEAPVLLSEPTELFYVVEPFWDDDGNMNRTWDSLDDPWDELDTIVQRSHRDWSVFREHYVSWGNPLAPSPSAYPSHYPFCALSSLFIDVTSPIQLSLIFFTSSFPSLRYLAFSVRSSSSVTAETLQTLRRSVTIVTNPSPSSHGDFLYPTEWSLGDFAFLEAGLDLHLPTESKMIPSLSPKELEEYKRSRHGRCGGYGGPQLVVLDCSMMDLWLVEED
ncbi:hypothetical protein JCM8097_001428 [Rhodosporidiobolus ruineniae]